MFTILFWIVFGFFVGIIAKFLHPGEDPVGFLPTMAIGIAGSLVGGAINYLIGFGRHGFHPSGIIMSILGGIICCAVWRWYCLQNSQQGPRNFLNGKLK